MAGYKLGDGTIESLTGLQQDFIALVESKNIDMQIRLAGFEVERATQVETMSVTDYADMLKTVRLNNPGVLEHLTS